MIDSIFFEKQYRRFCAQHALNMLLQQSIFNANNLVSIAKELDDRERSVLSPDASVYFQSKNYDASGYFSIQVIQVALQKYNNISLIRFDCPAGARYRENSSSAKAYLIHKDDHWFAIRRFGANHWFLLNSLSKGPQYITPTYLDCYLAQLVIEGFSVFVVQGELPTCEADIMMDSYNLHSSFELVDRNGKKPINDDISKAIQQSLIEQARMEDDTNMEEDAVFIALANSIQENKRR